MMKHLHQLVFAATLLSATSAGAAKLTPELLEQRNAAAGYAGTLKYMVGLGAKTCRDLLHKDDAYMNAIVDDWLWRNGKYSSAAEQWMGYVLSTIASQQGLEKGTAARDSVMATTKNDATAGITAILGDTPEKQQTACAGYADLIHSGKLDITPAGKLYPELTELERAVHAPPQ